MKFTQEAEKWKQVFEDCESVPEFTPSQVMRGIGVLMRRLNHSELERRKDRLKIDELVRDNDHMRGKLQKVNDFLTEGSKTAIFCAAAPRFEDLEVYEPRDMSVPEMQWLQESVVNIKECDTRLPTISRIIGVVPNAEGALRIDILEMSTLQRWHLYYFLKHKVVHKTATPSLRSKKKQAEIDSAPTAISVSSTASGSCTDESTFLTGTALESDDDDYDW